MGGGVNLSNLLVEKSLPCLATMTLETASGTLVPAARKVIPMTLSGILRVSPITANDIFFVKK